MDTTWHESVAQREDTVRLGVWMFLATVTMLFAAFASAYIVRRSGSDWVPIGLPTVLWLNTMALLGSSLALEAGSWMGSRRQWRRASAVLGSAFALGLAFLAGQVLAWQELMAAGVYMPASPHSAFFYLLTGVHAVHLVGALAFLGTVCVRTWAGLGARDADRWRYMTGLARTVWHFLLGIWVFVFLLLAIG